MIRRIISVLTCFFALFAGLDAIGDDVRIKRFTFLISILSILMLNVGFTEAVNHAPVAERDLYGPRHPPIAVNHIELNVSAFEGVLGNDSDEDGDAITAVLDTNPSHGTLSFNPDGSFIYHPNFNSPFCDFADDSFTYHVNDGSLDSNIARVDITVSNSPPFAEDDHYETAPNQILNVAAPGVMSNDGDENGDTLSVMSSISDPEHGFLHLDSDGSFTYQPEEGFVGEDSFSYFVTDGNLIDGCDTALSNEAIVTITVSNSTFGCPEASFSAPINSPLVSGRFPGAIAAADFNRDGKLDLITANEKTYNVTLLLGDGNGNFVFDSTVDFSENSLPKDLVIADFNLDMKPDFAVSIRDIDLEGFAEVFLGDGSGNFVFSGAIGQDVVPRDIVSADFNLDRKPDLAGSFLGEVEPGSGFTIGLGDGLGHFMQTKFFLDIGDKPIIAPDFNTDGKPDLALGVSDPDGVMVLLGDGTGGFNEAPGSFVAPSPYSLVSADFNLDGKPDLAVANKDSDNVTIALGDGKGGFVEAAGSPYAVGDQPLKIVTADFNFDGKADLAIANRLSNSVTILLGEGNGTFRESAGSPLKTHLNPKSLVVGDFNGDSRPDLATANSNSHDVSVLLNTCPEPPILFHDDFNDQEFQNPPWKFERGSWSAASGDLVGSSKSSGTAFAPDFGGCSDGVCSITANVEIRSDGARVSVFGWYQNKGNSVELRLSNDLQQLGLFFSLDGKIIVKKKINIPVQVNQNYLLKMTFDGASFQVFVNDVQLMTVATTAHPSSTGTVAFRVNSPTGLKSVGVLKDILVTK